MDIELELNYPHHKANPEVANVWRPVDYCVLDKDTMGDNWLPLILDCAFYHWHRWN